MQATAPPRPPNVTRSPLEPPGLIRPVMLPDLELDLAPLL
jgi:hypothetical protein